MKKVVIEIHSEMNDDFEYEVFKTEIDQMVETNEEFVYLSEGDEFEEFDEEFESIISGIPNIPFEPYQIYVVS